ncbi:MAG TPA: AmmeMemoRadiSam system radical SAM enzyme [Nevskiaceae bacterium]|nr:AmmeMemoRadiSam system radical SAM enzyme [Nevskiaceae bacterium]
MKVPMKEANKKLYQKLGANKIRCLACQRKCLILPDKVGFCLTRQNKQGKLYALNYGLITGVQIDPIEKKPLYHFYPGSPVASVGSYGCNFHCKQCLNYSHSWGEPATRILKQQAMGKNKSTNTAEQLVKQIKKNDYPGIAFTYNEPATNPEFIHDTAKMAKKEDLFTVFVTNGSWTKEALDYYGKYIDAANIDFKGFTKTIYAKMGAFFGQIPKMAKYAQEKYKIHLEITTLLIPSINDNPRGLKKMTEWMVRNLGPKTPWHLSRFDPHAAPDEKFAKIPPTSVEQLKKAAEIGQKAGLKFIYIWAPDANIPGGFYSQADTACPGCGNLAISRTGWQPHILGVNKDGNCPDCEENLNVKL